MPAGPGVPGAALHRQVSGLEPMAVAAHATVSHMKTIAQRELRNDNAKIISRVAEGESFIVTRNGEPLAELRPFTATRSRFIRRAALEAFGPAAQRIDRHNFRRDLDESLDPDA